MTDKKHIVSITLDERTKSHPDNYGKNHAISRSAVVRLVVNEFFGSDA